MKRFMGIKTIFLNGHINEFSILFGARDRESCSLLLSGREEKVKKNLIRSTKRVLKKYFL
jgi:hypothetical protein